MKGVAAFSILVVIRSGPGAVLLARDLISTAISSSVQRNSSGQPLVRSRGGIGERGGIVAF